MCDSNTFDTPTPFRFGNDCAYLLFGHLWIDIIFQIANVRYAQSLPKRNGVGVSNVLLSHIDCAYLLFGHLWIDIIFQIANVFAPCVVAHDSFKNDDASYTGVCDGGDQSVTIKWLSCELN